LATAFGKNFDDWIGQHIVIKAEPTSFGGKPTKGIRLYSANGEDAPALKGPKSKKTSSSEDINDDIDM
jgi:hypothetical protein